MKFGFRILIFSSIILLSIGVLAFSVSKKGITEIEEALVLSFKQKRAERIAVFFDNTIELTINNKQNTYSKDHAVIILNDYFAKSNFISYQKKYTGATLDANSLYLIGFAFTPSDSFKVFVLLKNTNGQLLIDDLKIDN